MEKKYRLGIIGEILDGILTDIKDLIDPPKNLRDLVRKAGGDYSTGRTRKDAKEEKRKG